MKFKQCLQEVFFREGIPNRLFQYFEGPSQKQKNALLHYLTKLKYNNLYCRVKSIFRHGHLFTLELFSQIYGSFASRDLDFYIKYRIDDSTLPYLKSREYYIGKFDILGNKVSEFPIRSISNDEQMVQFQYISNNSTVLIYSDGRDYHTPKADNFYDDPRDEIEQMEYAD